MLVRVIDPPDGKTWIYNGYFNMRVGVGQETELPDVILRWDEKANEWKEKEQQVPKWAELVGPSPDGVWKQKVGKYPVDTVERSKAVRPAPEQELAGSRAKQVRGGTRGGVGKRPSDTAIG